MRTCPYLLGKAEGGGDLEVSAADEEVYLGFLPPLQLLHGGIDLV